MQNGNECAEWVATQDSQLVCELITLASHEASRQYDRCLDVVNRVLIAV